MRALVALTVVSLGRLNSLERAFSESVLYTCVSSYQTVV